MQDVIERAVAEREIGRQLLCYCRAMDRCDAELGRSVFHPDAEVDYGPMFKGSGYDFVDFALEAHHQMFESHLHRISNMLVELDGMTAGSESYVEARFRSIEDGVAFDVYTSGRYLDRWENRNGAWAIVSRRYVNELAGKRVVGESPFVLHIGGIPFEIEGKRDATDPSYQALKGRKKR